MTNSQQQRDTTRIWRCVGCGVEMKGRRWGDEVRASNAAPAPGPPLPAVCVQCQPQVPR